MSMYDPVHPGELFRDEVLEALGITQDEAANRLGVTRDTLNKVVNGHRAVTPNLAVRLEEAGVSTARAWLAMQAAYDLAQERRREHGEVRQLVSGRP